MIKLKKVDLVIAAILTLYMTTPGVKGIDNKSLDNVLAGITHSDSLISNISFDYVVDYNVSEKWRSKQLEFMPLPQDLPMEMEWRVPTLEHTLRTGSATFEGNKSKIVSEKAALSDQKVFENRIVACDGVTFRELNLLENAGYICDVNSHSEGDLMFDPTNFPVLFADGQPLHSALTAKNTTGSLVGTEEIDGTKCYIIEMVENFTTPEGTQEQSRRRCWIAPDKGYRIKKAILYDTNSLDDKPLTVTQCELTEAAKGIWYYSKVTFQSYPLSLPEPDVIAVLQVGNIVINQQLNDNTFALPFPEGCIIDDQISGVRYKAGSSLQKLKEILDQLVDETLTTS